MLQTYPTTYEEWLQSGLGGFEPDAASANDLQRRGEAVAERHLRTGSPEFREWFRGRYDDDVFAALVVGMVGDQERQAVARAALRTIRDDWRAYVCGGPWELRTEIRMEP